MTDATACPVPDFGTDARRITPGQAFAALPPRWALQVLDPSDALDLDRGAWIIAEPCDRWRGDCRYVLWSGEVVRLRALWRGEELELTRGDGLAETITLAEAREMVAARVVAVCEKRIHLTEPPSLP